MLQYQLKMEDAPILRLLDSIITEGLTSGTSDIHLEPGTEYDRVRYRIDGVLQQVQRLPMERHAALVSCVKLMAGMDIAEKRKPQDGRAQVKHENMKVDLRVSSLPTVLGEKIVVRIMDSDTNRLRLEGMDFTTNNLSLYRDMYRSSYGMVLITGPTGSGKTTTLYATLQELNNLERKIVTIEDPVAYCMEGVNQVAVNTKIGMTFASG
ncbi:MAG: Flp pilus assembly complex ATPase component TadA, partial [Spirochaetaceae bacterium]|nr:Flp pilus assembly complex ATPase component TadA [Spirochaetaceae bacterium]